MTTDLKEVFKKAKAELQARGRINGGLLDGKGRCCLLGAIGLAAGVPESELLYGTYEPFKNGGLAYEATKVLLGTIPDEVIDWFGYSPDMPRDYLSYEDVYAFNDSYAPIAGDEKDDAKVFELLDRASA